MSIIQDIFIRSSWFIILALCLTLGHNLWRAGFSSIFHRRDVILSAILTAIVAISVPWEFRTLADETNLMSTAQSMTLRHTIENTLEMDSQFDNHIPLGGIVPKRPMLYSFFQSIVHLLTGFTPHAGVIVNLLVLFFFLLVVWSQTTGNLGVRLLMLSCPVITLYATSSGFDLLAAVVLFYTIIIAASGTARVHEPKRVILLLILLAHSRYESFLYAIIIGAVYTYLNQDMVRAFFTRKNVPFMVACLVFISPLIVQQMLSFGAYENPAGTKLFGLENAVRNVTAFVKNAWRLDLYLPFNTILLASFPIMSIVYAISFYRHRAKSALVVLLIAWVNIAIVMFHIAGDITHPTQVRYFIFIQIAAAVLLTSFIYMMLEDSKHRHTVLTMMGIVSFLVFHPVAIEDKLHNTLILNREYRIMRNFLADKKDYIVVVERPGLFAAQMIPAIGFERAQKKETLDDFTNRLKDGSIKKVYVMQHVYYETGVQDGHKLDWDLRELDFHKLNVDHKLVISELEI